jgi:hypothetical protein
VAPTAFELKETWKGGGGTQDLPGVIAIFNHCLGLKLAGNCWSNDASTWRMKLKAKQY